MTLSFTVNGVKKEIPKLDNIYTLNYPCSDNKSTCFPYESKLPVGKYRFHVYGAGGGSPKTDFDSPGGFSTGILEVKEKQLFYFFVGAKGICVTDAGTSTSTTFGGGGLGTSNGYGNIACSGGGASDVRLKKDNLKTRIIVAGGAGGFGHSIKDDMIGGKGGGENGTKGEDRPNYCTGGFPGTQTSGGSSQNNAGSFGFGGNNTQSVTPGGGGGWFGGGAGSCHLAGGGGGSGFVYLEDNSNVELDKKFQLVSGETKEGTNKEDGKILIEVLEFSPEDVSVDVKLLFFPFFLSKDKTVTSKHVSHFVKGSL